MGDGLHSRQDSRHSDLLVRDLLQGGGAPSGSLSQPLAAFLSTTSAPPVAGAMHSKLATYSANEPPPKKAKPSSNAPPEDAQDPKGRGGVLECFWFLDDFVFRESGFHLYLSSGWLGTHGDGP